MIHSGSFGTITFKSQGALGGASSGMTSEIIKGAGRFEKIKGTPSDRIKYLPVEKGQAGRKGYGEGTINCTLPPKRLFKVGVRAKIRPGNLSWAFYLSGDDRGFDICYSVSFKVLISFCR
jgi:hypothetical protein